MERMKGTPQEAFEYCRKDGDFYETGIEHLPKQGKRNDLSSTVQALRNGQDLLQIAETDSGCMSIVKYHRGLQTLQTILLNSSPLRNKTCIWLYGPTGSGKTKSAVDFANQINEKYWISGRDLQWFDGYCGQRVVIFDDFRWNHTSFSFFLRLLDRYELSVPIKGGFTRWNPAFIFITTPKTVIETFDYDNRESEDLKQVERRIHHSIQFPHNEQLLIWQGLKLKHEDTLKAEKQGPNHKNYSTELAENNSSICHSSPVDIPVNNNPEVAPPTSPPPPLFPELQDSEDPFHSLYKVVKK